MRSIAVCFGLMLLFELSRIHTLRRLVGLAAAFAVGLLLNVLAAFVFIDGQPNALVLIVSKLAHCGALCNVMWAQTIDFF